MLRAAEREAVRHGHEQGDSGRPGSLGHEPGGSGGAAGREPAGGIQVGDGNLCSLSGKSAGALGDFGDRPSSGKRNSAAVPLRRWKRLTLAAGLLCLALLAALGWILYSAHQDGWPPPEDPQITGVYFYDAAGQEIAKSDFGWYLFPPDSTVNVAVTFQDGREHTVDQVVLFLYPTGTGVAEERQQIGVRRIRDGRTFALFRWQIPASLYSHLEVQLECGDGQTISVSQWNVIDRDSAF